MLKNVYLLVFLTSSIAHASTYQASNGIEFEIDQCLKDSDCKQQLIKESPVKIAKILNDSKNQGQTKLVLTSLLDEENLAKFDSLYRLRTVNDQNLLNKRDAKKVEISLNRMSDTYKFNYATDYIRNNHDQFKNNSYINILINNVIRDEIKNSSPLSDQKKEKLNQLHKEGLINLSHYSQDIDLEDNKSDECYDCSVQTASTSEYMSVTNLVKVAQQMIKVTSTWSSECNLDAKKIEDDVFFYNKTRRAKRDLQRYKNTTYINQETFEDGCTKKIEAKTYRK
ncbi:hypothetical protein [Halobacteriovorax sp.]|uniref:hypothetical protein n=1 Tax=Halobacteriovorax sp. TaxID=2020862 RepID=UPI003AF2E004